MSRSLAVNTSFQNRADQGFLLFRSQPSWQPIKTVSKTLIYLQKHTCVFSQVWYSSG